MNPITVLGLIAGVMIAAGIAEENAPVTIGGFVLLIAWAAVQ